MINYIIGKLVEIDENQLVIENNGIAYEVYFPKSNIRNLPNVGEELKIYTYMAVKEDDISLYGFFTKEDKKMFMLLITVSGVGPKGAMATISNFGFSELVKIILASDAKKISSVPSIGSKTASKIIIELSDKIKKLNFASSNDLIKESNEYNEKIIGIQNEVIEALCSLGYQKKTATELVNSLDVNENTKADELLKLALKRKE